jgi:hypothetical protein
MDTMQADPRTETTPQPPKAERPKGTGDFLQEMEELQKALLAHLDAKESTEARNGRDRLNRRFWEEILAVVKRRSGEGRGKRLEFTDDEKDLIDFGYVPIPSMDLPAETPDRIAAYRKAAADHGVRLLHEYLQDAYRRASLRDKRKGAERESREAAETFQAHRKSIQQTQDTRATFIRENIAGAEAAKLIEYNRAIDEHLWEIIDLEYKKKNGGLRTRDERLRFVELRDLVTSARRDRDRVLDLLPQGPDVRIHTKEIEDGFEKSYRLALQLKKAERHRHEVTEEAAQVTGADLQLAMEDEIKMLRSFAQMSARYAKTVPFGPITSPDKLPHPETIEETFRHIQSFDPGLFDNRHAKSDGKPRILIFPGNGTGTYDWSRNRLLIPSQPTGDLVQVLSYAAVMYRYDVDQQRNDRALILSFQKDVKENEGLRSVRALREALVDSYVTWIAKESLGFGVLSREMREWFEQEIGPKKNQPIFPVELQGMKTSEARAKIASMKKESALQTPENLYTLALCEFVSGEHENSLKHFDRACQKKEDFHEAYYSAAMVCFALHQTGAKSRLQTYLKIAPQSWWTKKAQEHLRRLR